MQFPPTKESARITEVFSSIQGEGLCQGQRHLFIRFEECHMKCRYCDEIHKVGEEMNLEALINDIRRLEAQEGPHSFVSLTGGEPLLYVDFLDPLMDRLRAENLRIHLETSGVLWTALEKVIDKCDVIAMDMKPSSVTGEASFDHLHERFLKLALQKNVFVKFTISPQLDQNEFDRETGIIAAVDPAIPVFLQGVSGSFGSKDDKAMVIFLQNCQRRAAKQLKDVRISFRIHEILEMR